MEKEQKRKYRCILIVLMIMDLCLMGWMYYREVDKQIPKEMHVSREETTNLGYLSRMPFVTFTDAVETSGSGSWQIACKLFGMIPVKNVKVVPEETPELYVSGDTIGIYMETDGVLIVDTGEIISESGKKEEPARNLVHSGDYIVMFNHKPIKSKKELVNNLRDLDGTEVTMNVRRENQIIPVSFSPVKDKSGEYKLGIWVRDDTQGIGTLTYVKENGDFGALGHGISDVDTGELLNIQEGALYQAKVMGIVKGSKGFPGELSGVIHYDRMHLLGEIQRNTRIGIFGRLGVNEEKNLFLKKYPIAYRQEAETGDVTLLADVGSEVEAYTARIVKIDWGCTDSNKSFIIEVTDERLLSRTGGIVQGMSGSPIIQDGKLVGAVTHVLVNDPTRGYGIFIENMLDAAG